MNGALQDCLSSLESWSTIIRNFGLVAAAVFALWFARKRILVADRQADTAQRGLLNERYQKGAEMLGSKVLAVRRGGIYALARLARDDHSGDYHIAFTGRPRPPKASPMETRLFCLRSMALFSHAPQTRPQGRE